MRRSGASCESIYHHTPSLFDSPHGVVAVNAVRLMLETRKLHSVDCGRHPFRPAPVLRSKGPARHAHVTPTEAPERRTVRGRRSRRHTNEWTPYGQRFCQAQSLSSSCRFVAKRLPVPVHAHSITSAIQASPVAEENDQDVRGLT